MGWTMAIARLRALLRLGFYRTATIAAITRHQSAALHVKRQVIDDAPLMEATFTERLALVLLRKRRFFEFNDVAHVETPRAPQDIGCQRVLYARRKICRSIGDTVLTLPPMFLKLAHFPLPALNAIMRI